MENMNRYYAEALHRSNAVVIVSMGPYPTEKVAERFEEVLKRLMDPNIFVTRIAYK